jgi:hypothetical protein
MALLASLFFRQRLQFLSTPWPSCAFSSTTASVSHMKKNQSFKVARFQAYSRFLKRENVRVQNAATAFTTFWDQWMTIRTARIKGAPLAHNDNRPPRQCAKPKT